MNKPKIDKEMVETIFEFLTRIERVFNVTIMFAVESGSRAWGFESQDSDYDIRFVYIERAEYYMGLPIRKPNLPIEEVIARGLPLRAENDKLRLRDLRSHPEFHDLPELLDFDGWEFRKAAGYASIGKPVLLEWLNSPVCYMERVIRGPHSFLTREFFIEHAAQFVTPSRLLDHYAGQVLQMVLELKSRPDFRPLKKILYALRCIGAHGWVLENYGKLPKLEGTTIDGVPKQLIQIEFDQLRPSLLNALKREGLAVDEFDSYVTELLSLKQSGDESQGDLESPLLNTLLTIVRAWKPKERLEDYVRWTATDEEELRSRFSNQVTRLLQYHVGRRQ